MRYSGILPVLVLLGACATRGQDTSTPPPGMTAEDVEQGRALYHGVGGCVPCHGEEGAGTADGPALNDGVWKLGDGSLLWLVHMTRHAGWGMRTRDDEPRPMRGPTVLDSTQVRQVAAYVWSISRDDASSDGRAR